MDLNKPIAPAPNLADARLAHAWALLLPIAVLLGLICWRVWDLGVTHTDDAWWLLRSFSSYFKASDNWAREQGRLWAYVSGSLIMFALVWQDTVFGELLRLGSFVLFFAVFHLVAAVYCGRRLAVLSASLFVAFFALKWDGSILTTYPLITWPAATACACALLAGRAYVRGSARWPLPLAALLLLFALLNNEGVTVTCIALALLSVPASVAQAADGARRGRRLLLAFLAVSLLYALLYVGWRLMFPTIYGGNTIAAFNPRRILRTLWHFSTSGSLLHELLSPLSLAYADPFGSGSWIQYSLKSYARTLGQAPLALLAGALSGWLLWRQLRQPAPEHASRLRWALAGGLTVALLPILPVALVVNYQDWVANSGVRAYSHTVFAYFGWSLVLAALLVKMAGRFGRRRWYAALVLALAAGGALVAALGYRANDAIALDLRPEAGRWGVIHRAVAVNQAVFKSAVLWGPGLAQRSQYGHLYPNYWGDYVKARYGQDTEVAERIPDINDLVNGVVMLDFGYDAAARRMVSLFMQYRKDGPTGGFVGGTVAVDLDGAGAATDYLLAWRDASGPRQSRLSALQAVPARPGLYLLAPPAGIDPASVRLLRAGQDSPLARIRVPHGLRIDFRLPRVPRPAIDPASMLDAGWYPLDAASVWSRGGELHVRIPRALLPPGPLHLDLDVASYTSIGYYDGLQKMSASIDGRPLGQWDYRSGHNPDIAADLPAPDPGAASWDLRMDVAPSMNPRALGVDPANPRELGMQLRSVILNPPGPPP